MRILLFLIATTLSAQTFSPTLYSGLRWRDIGPFRGGRTVGAAGIASQPNVFFIRSLQYLTGRTLSSFPVEPAQSQKAKGRCRHFRIVDKFTQYRW
jgi:hypothetical protein